jgi:hypothetical protein
MIDNRTSEYETENLEDIGELIYEHKRRRHELKLKAARFGTSTAPEIKLEIEDIERELAKLSAKKLELEQRQALYERRIERGERQREALLRWSNNVQDLGIIAFILCSIALLFWFFTRDKILVISMTLGIGVCLLFVLVIRGRQ